MKTMTRYGIGLPLAAFVTVALTTAMGAMIATEFQAEEKAEVLDFQINPLVEDEPVEIEVTKLEAFEEVEVPPAPPTTGIESTDRVVIEPIVAKTITPEMPTEIVLTAFTPADTAQQPILRFPPAMPQRANRSGHCDVRFNVSAQGVPYDIETTYCTQSLFQRSTLKSVAKWKYRPRIQNGQAVAMTGVKNRVTYRLTDERGNIIP